MGHKVSVKFYALCCRNMYAVKRHQRYIPKEDLVIVINTLDKEFENSAAEYCKTENIEYHITESNGGPSKGKNSVFDIFQSSNYDYCVLIDGDDFITPHGVWTYKQIAKMEPPIDALALEHQWGIYAENGYNKTIQRLFDTGAHMAGNPAIGTTDKTNMEAIHGSIGRPFYRTETWWERATSGKMIEEFPGDEASKNFNLCYTEWSNYCFKYISQRESHLRLVMFSKKLVESGYRFDENFTVGEDTLLYLKIKKGHTNKEIILKHLFDRYPTYIYDTRVSGIVVQERHKINDQGIYQMDYGWYLWLRKLTDEYIKYEKENILSEEKIERITVKTTPDPEDSEPTICDINWPEDYKPDLCKLATFPGKLSVSY